MDLKNVALGLALDECVAQEIRDALSSAPLRGAENGGWRAERLTPAAGGRPRSKTTAGDESGESAPRAGAAQAQLDLCSAISSGVGERISPVVAGPQAVIKELPGELSWPLTPGPFYLAFDPVKTRSVPRSPGFSPGLSSFPVAPELPKRRPPRQQHPSLPQAATAGSAHTVRRSNFGSKTETQ